MQCLTKLVYDKDKRGRKENDEIIVGMLIKVFN